MAYNYSIRKTCPNGQKEYITKSAGGYSACIVGSPTKSGANVLANCVGYACGRFNEVYNLITGNQSNKYANLNCNAENFIERAVSLGLQVVSNPVAGGIMVFQKGATLSGNDGAGHVMFVEEKYSNDDVYTSESGYGSSTPFWNSRRKRNSNNWGMGSAYKYRGCIINPVVKEEPTPTPPAPTKSVDEIAREVIRGDWGNNPERKQRLEAAGYNYSAVQGRVNEILAGNKPTPAPSRRTHTVQRGENLSVIARKYGTTWNKIYADNKSVIGSNPNMIHAGQVLVIN